MKNLQTLVREGFKARLFQAHKALEAKEGIDVGREEIGRRVGKALGTGAVSRDTVAAWFTRVLPPADVGAGLAQVYSVPAGWLYFGEQDQRVEIAREPTQPLPIELQEKTTLRRKKNG